MKPTKPFAAVAGNICLDITPVFPARKAANIGDILQPGKLVQIGEADVHTGGAVANVGLALRLFGVETLLLGKVGRDYFGESIMSVLGERGASSGMIVSDGASTSYTVVVAVPGFDRFFLHNPGANDTVSCADIDFASLEGASLFHFGYPPLMRRIYRDGGRELVELFRRMDAMGAVTSLDLAAVDPSSDAGSQDWRGILERVLPFVDLFEPSIEELCFMIDRPRYDRWREEGKNLERGLSVSADILPLADALTGMGAGNFIIKCGAAGFFYRLGGRGGNGGSDRDGGRSGGSIGRMYGSPDASSGEGPLRRLERKLGRALPDWAGREGFEKSYEPAVVRSATGAGDTMIAAFLAAMVRGYSLDRCLRLAAATGASCVEAYDALGGIRTLEEQERHIGRGWNKQNLVSD